MTPTAVKEKDQLARIEAELARSATSAPSRRPELESAKETFAAATRRCRRTATSSRPSRPPRQGRRDRRPHRRAERDAGRAAQGAGKDAPRGTAPPATRRPARRRLGRRRDARRRRRRAMLLGQYANSARRRWAATRSARSRRATRSRPTSPARPHAPRRLPGRPAAAAPHAERARPDPDRDDGRNTFPYTQEGGAFTGAAETDEGAAKPEGGITFTDAEATARTIAAWLKLQKQSLEDVPALQAIIESRLRYLVERRLEAQILNGNGTAPNLRGILQTSGIGTVAFDAGAGEGRPGARRHHDRAARRRAATGIVMNPSDWAAR
jgi:hypothetical protein